MNHNKNLADMNLTDSFLFGVAMDNEKSGPLLAGTILKTIFQRDIQIKRINPERVILPPGRELHGVRLDAYIEEESAEVLPGSIYDLEPENKSAERDQLRYKLCIKHSLYRIWRIPQGCVLKKYALKHISSGFNRSIPCAAVKPSPESPLLPFLN